jgi:WD40 repeat protein
MPDGKLVSADHDGQIRVWENGACLMTLDGHASCVKALIAFPHGGLASGSYDSTVRMWH